MATINAFIRTSSKKDTVNLRFRLTDGRDFQLFHKSNISVQPDHWDEKKQCIKPKVVTNYDKKLLNDKVNSRKKLISDIYERIGKSLTSEVLDSEITKIVYPEKLQNTQNNCVLEFIAKFIADAPSRKDKITGRLLTYNNIQQYKATQKHLTAFVQSLSKKSLSFSEIDKRFYDQFVAYLQLQNFTQNTVGKHIRILKLMLNESNNKEINLKDFHVFTEEVDSVYLNENELQQLKDYDFSQYPHLERVRDWFLLLAWTGCRISDLEKIKQTDIKDNFITFRQQKTNNKVTIPLHPVVVEVLSKYKYQMPEQISTQKFNVYIKEVCKCAEINNNETLTRTVGGRLNNNVKPKYNFVGSHTGRRSFCTNMYKRGLPTLMIMSISGHKTEKSFLKYIKVRQEEHAEMMKKAWEKIY